MSNDRFVDGSLDQVLQSSQMDFGKILLVSHISMPRAPVEISKYSSDMYAWNETKGEPYCKETEPVPTGDIRWGRVSLNGAFTGWTLIPKGFGAVIEVKTGEEWLIVARPPVANDGEEHLFRNHFGSVPLFIEQFDPRKPMSCKWRLEAMYLIPFTRV